MTRRILVITIATAVLLALSAYTTLRIKYPPVMDWKIQVKPDPLFDTLDPWIRDSFLDTTSPVTERYADVFRYLIAGFLAYKSEGSSRANYPGFASSHGRDIDGLEGFSRIAPLIAAWLAGGRPEAIQVPFFGEVNLPALLRSGIETGTDPASTEYWGDIEILDQRVVEAADIALAVWLSRNTLWTKLDPGTRARLVSWLAQADGKDGGTRYVNWRLFPMIVNRTLKSLGEPVSDDSFKSAWSDVRSSYVGDGWFRDSADGHFDYYNAWSFHYSLYWLTEIDDTFESRFVATARNEFVSFYRHLVTPRGFPILGRSICYRTAMPVPLLIASLTDKEVIPFGEARRALDVTWRYFIEKGALVDGVLTQGYCSTDLRTLDLYSGPASCLWGTRSLVVALSQPDHAPLWTSEEAPLAIERSGFSITNTKLNWQLEGDQEQASVVIRVLGNSANPSMMPYSIKHKFASMLFQRPFLPINRRAKYDRAVYSSSDPFCGCANEDQ